MVPNVIHCSTATVCVRTFGALVALVPFLVAAQLTDTDLREASAKAMMLVVWVCWKLFDEEVFAS